VRKGSLLVVLALLVVLLIITTARFPFSERIKGNISGSFMPFLEFSSRLQGSFAFLVDRFKAYTKIQTENTELKKEVSELRVRVAQVGELERENRDFRAMLDFKNRSELKLISAKVISRDPSNWFNTVIVDRGALDGVVQDFPVLTVDGLVGKIIDVTPNNARILLLVDENCKVSAWLKETGQYGIVQGNVLLGGRDSQCRITFIDRLAKIQKDDKVFTSGLGGIFPKGILIGTVRDVTATADANKQVLYQEVSITPAVDLARIDEVFIGVGVKAHEKAKAATKKSRGEEP
jgi:rod shape-determining protein MreC